MVDRIEMVTIKRKIKEKTLNIKNTNRVHVSAALLSGTVLGLILIEYM